MITSLALSRTKLVPPRIQTVPRRAEGAISFGYVANEQSHDQYGDLSRKSHGVVVVSMMRQEPFLRPSGPFYQIRREGQLVPRKPAAPPPPLRSRGGVGVGRSRIDLVSTRERPSPRRALDSRGRTT